MQSNSRTFAILGIVASILGLTFAALSSIDYAQHLDRHLHDVHCSLIPGLTSGADEENPCRAAMYSAYSAILRGDYWGGIPISLFALGAFAFFLGFSLYLFFAGAHAPRTALLFFGATGVTPLLVSLLMFVISITKLGTVCLTCVGIYVASALLAVAALLAFRSLDDPFVARPAGRWAGPLMWVLGLGAATLIPSVVYASAVPDHRSYMKSCGKLEKAVESHNALLKMKTAKSVRPATLFEDPLCPTCRAFHQRMVAEDAFDRLDVQMAMFPLDSDCNWMLTTPLHPGACLVSKAVICGGEQSRQVLEWAYDEQDDLVKAAKAGEAQLKARISRRWGPQILSCMDTSATKIPISGSSTR